MVFDKRAIKSLFSICMIVVMMIGMLFFGGNDINAATKQSLNITNIHV